MRIATILTILAAGAANAAPALTDIEVGVFCALPPGEHVPAPDTTLGFIEKPETFAEFLWPQTKAPAAIGVSFGIKATAMDEPFSATVRVTHPPFDGHDRTTESWVSEYSPGSVTGSYFTFDFPYEQQVGDWKFEVVSDIGKILMSQEFVIVPQDKLRHIVDACTGEAPLS